MPQPTAGTPGRRSDRPGRSRWSRTAPGPRGRPHAGGVLRWSRPAAPPARRGRHRYRASGGARGANCGGVVPTAPESQPDRRVPHRCRPLFRAPRRLFRSPTLPVVLAEPASEHPEPPTVESTQPVAERYAPSVRWSRLAPVRSSSGSNPTSTSNSLATSSTVRAIGPAVSCRLTSGERPVRLTNPVVDRSP